MKNMNIENANWPGSPSVENTSGAFKLHWSPPSKFTAALGTGPRPITTSTRATLASTAISLPPPCLADRFSYSICPTTYCPSCVETPSSCNSSFNLFALKGFVPISLKFHKVTKLELAPISLVCSTPHLAPIATCLKHVWPCQRLVVLQAAWQKSCLWTSTAPTLHLSETPSIYARKYHHEVYWPHAAHSHKNWVTLPFASLKTHTRMHHTPRELHNLMNDDAVDLKTSQHL